MFVSDDELAVRSRRPRGRGDVRLYFLGTIDGDRLDWAGPLAPRNSILRRVATDATSTTAHPEDWRTAHWRSPSIRRRGCLRLRVSACETAQGFCRVHEPRQAHAIASVEPLS